MNCHTIIALAAFTALTLPAAAFAQASPSAFTSAVRLDDMNRVVGTIAPDPGSGGAASYLATRTTYDAQGRVTRVEKGRLTSWQSESVLPSAWPVWNPGTSTGFEIFSQVDTEYDALDRKVKETLSSGRTPYQVTQYSYDAVGRLDCTVVRMNPSVFGSLPGSACTASMTGSYGPDRISKNVYDDAGQLLRVQKAYGTSLQQDYVTYTYSANGKPLTVKDANGNLAGYTYDGFDRQTQWNFPDKVTSGTISSTDYEAYTYDANGNRLSLRKRDGSVIGYTYDNLNRVTVKDIPGGTSADVYYGYDARDLQLYARFVSTSGAGITNTYDGFSRLATSSNNMSGSALTLSYQWDEDGNRTRVTQPDGNYFQTSYDGLDRPKHFDWWTSATSTVPFADFVYDAKGQRSGLNWAYTSTGYGYDGIGRLTSVGQVFATSTDNLTDTMTYSPASQIMSKVRSNTVYAWTGYTSVSRSYVANGLNQYSTAGSASFTYDANGNLTGDGTYTYTYDVENRLTAKSGGLTLTYDPLGRLWQTSGGASGTTRYLYDGDELAVEYDGSGTMLRRYMFAGQDEPILWDEGGTLLCSTTKFLHADGQGSLIASTDCSGNRLTVNSYDEYGIPASTNTGRFQYTGQAWLPDLGMYYYKARIYSPTLGRFMQTDPIGYADQNNLYAYVGSDPVNEDDPSGLCTGTYICGHKIGVTNFDGGTFGATAGTNVHQSQDDHTFRNSMAAGGAVLGGILGGTGGGAAGGAAGALCGPGVEVCAPAGAIAGGTAGRAAGATGGGIVGGWVGDKIDKGIALVSDGIAKMVGGNDNGYKSPTSGSGKEKASDIPSWVRLNRENRPRIGETPNQTATRVMDNRYGKGNWSRSVPEYSQIQKWAARSFK